LDLQLIGKNAIVTGASRGIGSWVLWDRLLGFLGRPASESARLRHVAPVHELGGLRRRAFM
jgi:hypothetical protein